MIYITANLWRKLEMALLAGILVTCFANCSKNGRELTSRNQLIDKMAYDEDVQIYYAMIQKQTNDLELQLQLPTREEIEEHAGDSSYRIPKKTDAEIMAAVKRATSMEQTMFLLKQAQKIHTKFNLLGKNEDEIRSIYEKVFDMIEKNQLIRRKKIQGKPEA
jgi:hypothetical protein